MKLKKTSETDESQDDVPPVLAKKLLPGNAMPSLMTAAAEHSSFGGGLAAAGATVRRTNPSAMLSEGKRENIGLGLSERARR